MKWWRFAAGVFILLLFFVAAQWPDGRLRLVFCDVGQGDASLITKGNFQMLIDTGPRNGGVLGCLAKHMPFWDRELEVVVGTHPQEDHMGDLAAIVAHYRIGEVILSDEKPVGKVVEKAYELIESNKIKQITAEKGDRLRYGSLSFDVLWPYSAEASKGEPQVLGKSNDPNQRALVLSMKYPGFSALFTSDIGKEQELALDHAGVLGKIDVLKVAHHGSKYSSSLAFGEKVRPKWAVVSVGQKNRYGHPAPEVLRRFEALGANIWRTDRRGGAEFVGDGKTYRLNVYH